MTSKTLFLTLAIFLAIASAQDCDNPLLDVFGITGLATPQTGANLTACPNLQAAQTCCSQTTLDALQTNLTNTSTALNTLAGERDLYIAQLYFNITTNYTNLTTQLQAFNNDISNIQQTNPAIGTALRAQYNIFIGIANSLVTDENTFTQNFVAYQQARTNCWTTLLQIESSAWCLACDPNYAALGVEPDGSVNAGDTICNAIQAACAPYLFDGLQFNALIQAQQTLARLNQTVAWFNAYRANGNQIPSGQDINAPATPTPQSTVTAPAGCTATACPWQCTNLFDDSFVLNQTLAANGAGAIGAADILVLPVIVVPVIEQVPVEEAVAEFEMLEEMLIPTEEIVLTETITETLTETVTEVVPETVLETVTETVEEVVEAVVNTTRLLEEDDKWHWRFLQTGTWNPALNNSGFNVTVENDPANVSNTESGGQPEITPTPTPQGATIVTVAGALFVLLASFMI